MNERIKLLAEQAGFNPYNYQGSNLALFEKFAELIVKECIKVLDTNNANLTLDAKWDAIYEIAQYFGVE